MKIKIQYRDAGDNDCKRLDYVTEVDGKKFLLAHDTLGNIYSDGEAERTAKHFFGDDVQIEW
jgi:hypothetical protein